MKAGTCSVLIDQAAFISRDTRSLHQRCGIMATIDTDTVFEVTEILASRLDLGGKKWYLVQWGCSWVPHSAMADGRIKDAWIAKTKLSPTVARVTIPDAECEQASQSSDDSEPESKRAK